MYIWGFRGGGLIFCFGVLICLSRGQRLSLCFLARALLLIPVHLGNSPLFFLKTFPFFLSSIPPLLSNTYPTLFCPSCPLARSEVETCVSLHLHGRERKKSEVRSLPPPFLRPPLPSLPAEESRQTGAEHGTFINPRQIAKNPLHTRCLCLQRGECGR